MGIESHFVCTSPPGLALDIKKLPSEVLEGLALSIDIPEETKTAEDLLSKLSYAAKIMGYLSADGEKGVAWKGLLQGLADQNEGVEDIQIHMYCPDYYCAYFMKLVDGTFFVFKGKEQDLLYHTSTWEESCGIFEVEFDEEKYVSIVRNPKQSQAVLSLFEKEEIKTSAGQRDDMVKHMKAFWASRGM